MGFHLLVDSDMIDRILTFSVCMILPGGGCRLQTCRGLAAQWSDSTLRTFSVAFSVAGVAVVRKSLFLFRSMILPGGGCRLQTYELSGPGV